MKAKGGCECSKLPSHFDRRSVPLLHFSAREANRLSIESARSYFIFYFYFQLDLGLVLHIASLR